MKNHWARKAEIYMEASWCRGHSSLFNSWSPGVRWGPIGDQSFTYDYIGEIFKIFSRTTGPGKLKFIWELPDIVEMQVCSNHDPQGYVGATIGDQSFTFEYILKIVFSRPKDNIYLKASWYRVESNLIKSYLPGVGQGHNRGSKFCIKCSSPEPLGQF